MAIADYLTWLSLGRPEAGRVRIHERLSYASADASDLPEHLRKAFGPLDRLRVADLGCGACGTIVGAQVLKIPFRRLASVEAFIPYIYQLKTKHCVAQQHDILEGRIENILEDFKLDEIEIMLLIEVLEHFERKAALKLLARMEKIARRGIVIFSPLGRITREPQDQNALQRYRSFWEPEDLTRLGYDVEVYRNFYEGSEPPTDAAWAIKKCGIGAGPIGNGQPPLSYDQILSPPRF